MNETTLATTECRADTYVGCPPPSYAPPECGDVGWEVTPQGQLVCATQAQAPQQETLATTGGGGDFMLGLVIVASLTVTFALFLLRGKNS